ncbi:Phosphoenolpyruvate synthase [uncultured archaeon]|nr:Phosphoenolpyruvate synthase [uncultured archaeon]
MASDGPRMVTFGHGPQVEITSEDFGNKAAYLARIAKLGIPVPPGFSLNVSICEEYYRNGGKLPRDVPDLLRQGIAFIERATGLTFGGSKPLLVSVRSGAPVTMPGIMETLLNVGLNRETLRRMMSLTGNPRFSWDCYRRLMENFGEVVFSHDAGQYRSLLNDAMKRESILDEVELESSSLKRLAGEYERIFLAGGRKLPEDVYEQLELAVVAVLRSWMNPRAQAFRRMNLVRNVRGTAVTVQAMVYGNIGPRSGAGVAFTRNPWTGENELLLDFKFGAQGEDVVSGAQSAATQRELLETMPQVDQELLAVGRKIESHFKDMQDIEFTVQEGKLYILQSRDGKRSPLAALRIAVELCQEGVISPQEALQRLREVDIESISVQKVISHEAPLAAGISASSGVASGRIAFTGRVAERFSAEGPVILVREMVTPDDIPRIAICAGILTARGARTSHAAVVARQMGKVCIVNCTDLEIDVPNHKCQLGGRELSEGDVITLDGNAGLVYLDHRKVEVLYEKPLALIAVVKSWERASENTILS